MASDDEGRSKAALVTGSGRLNNIAAGIAFRLADDGWNLALGYWRPPDLTDDEPEQLAAQLRSRGVTVALFHSDLFDSGVPDRLVTDAAAAVGPLSGLVLSHAESRDSAILDTTAESFDRHMAINARASWQLIAAFARQATNGGSIV